MCRIGFPMVRTSCSASRARQSFPYTESCSLPAVPFLPACSMAWAVSTTASRAFPSNFSLRRPGEAVHMQQDTSESLAGHHGHTQGATGKKKKDRGSFFFEVAFRTGLTKYVIRGITIYRSGITIYRYITSDTSWCDIY